MFSDLKYLSQPVSVPSLTTAKMLQHNRYLISRAVYYQSFFHLSNVV